MTEMQVGMMIVQMLTLLKKRKKMSRKEENTNQKTDREENGDAKVTETAHSSFQDCCVSVRTVRYTTEQRAMHVLCSLHRHLSI